jgi:hypothetical protein
MFDHVEEMSARGCGLGAWLIGVALCLFQNPVGNIGFQIPVDQRISGEIECGVRNHGYPKASRTRKDSTEGKSRDHGLLNARERLYRIVNQREPHRCQEHDRYLCANTSAKKFAEAFEHVSTEHSFLSEARSHDQGEKSGWDSGTVPCQEVVRLVGSRGTQERHHERLHQ